MCTVSKRGMYWEIVCNHFQVARKMPLFMFGEKSSEGLESIQVNLGFFILLGEKEKGSLLQQFSPNLSFAMLYFGKPPKHNSVKTSADVGSLCYITLNRMHRLILISTLHWMYTLAL